MGSGAPMKIGDRFVAMFDGRMYQVVGHYPMSYKTRWVNPETDEPCGEMFSMCPGDIGAEPTNLTPPEQFGLKGRFNTDATVKDKED